MHNLKGSLADLHETSKSSGILEHVPMTDAMKFLSQEEYESRHGTFISVQNKSDLRVIDQESVQTIINKLNRIELLFKSNSQIQSADR